MLVSRQNATEQSPWSISSKFETTFHKSTDSIRMSNHFDSVSQSDWQGQYSFLPPGDNNLFSQPYDHVASSTDNAESSAQPRSVTAPEIEPKQEQASPVGHRLDPLGLRQPKQQSPIPEQPESHGEQYATKPAESVHEESLVSTETPSISLTSNPLSSVSSTGQGSEAPPSQPISDAQPAIKDEEEDVLEDEEMVEGEGDGEAPSQPQTAAERTAQRRKMKRFRLTHQQTRFLMSEFAKQPHPDAAHRERLSREIPGLSPRQVQVWFQNRRAKIKRLTADDRDRMIKMRAVPDDFDNVQALHSPYGAVHGLGTPITSPVDFGGSSYTDHIMRPLMVDVRRGEGDDHLSPTGLSPAFGSIGFNPSATISTPDILSPMSPSSADRYGYPSHMSGPLSAGPRTSNPFARQPSLDSSMQQMHSHNSRQQIRPLQPLQLRETMHRSRSDSLQSPLRSSMSWKGDSIDYTTYHGASSPQMGGRQPGLYQQDQMGAGSTSGLAGYDSSNYSGSTVQSPTHMYSSFQSSSLQPNQQRGSRLRAASASLPLGLDLRNQFRSSTVGSGNPQPSAHSPGPRTPTSQFGGVSSSYTASFPSAPLTAPVDFSLPRTPGFRSSGADYSMPQMSAPIAPPNDFSQAFQASMSSSNARTPMRDTFGGGPLNIGQNQNSTDRTDDYSQDPMGLKRKRSFTGSATANSTTTAAYSSTA
ncbi:pah2 homeobox protein encoded by the pah2 protein [Podospora aff. communis PSN243]|uniref:Pah2 homeobox protein encoded by the pah2 protein n=1 Tax=Podospora aff. communis PSN243 TaxID=3040156 RepID=A0AAV9H0P9_9PEZI|nr:pah2 homeobox protein encoded by the pah2 protein [Podospora aff. communis PSN243]